MKKDDAVKKIGDMLGDRHIHMSDTKMIKIQQRSVYHKFTEVEIKVPNDVHESELMDWINDNEQLWSDQMDAKEEHSEYESGSGVYDYDGMNESTSDSEWRFQCPNGYGGHL